MPYPSPSSFYNESMRSTFAALLRPRSRPNLFYFRYSHSKRPSSQARHQVRTDLYNYYHNVTHVGNKKVIVDGSKIDKFLHFRVLSNFCSYRSLTVCLLALDGFNLLCLSKRINFSHCQISASDSGWVMTSWISFFVVHAVLVAYLSCCQTVLYPPLKVSWIQRIIW